MLGILFLYFIGKYFYELAHEYNKNRWGYAILGVVTFYAGTALFGLGIGLSDAFFDTDFVSSSDLVINLIATPFGVLAAWGLYRLLKSKWRKKAIISDSDVLDDQFIS